MHYECWAGPSTAATLTSREQLVSLVRNEIGQHPKDASASRRSRRVPQLVSVRAAANGTRVDFSHQLDGWFDALPKRP